MACSLLAIAVLLRVLLAPMKQRANLVTIGIAACMASLVATPSDDASVAAIAEKVPPPALQRPPAGSHSGYSPVPVTSVHANREPTILSTQASGEIHTYGYPDTQANVTAVPHVKYMYKVYGVSPRGVQTASSNAAKLGGA
jgi:hypothetical protein